MSQYTIKLAHHHGEKILWKHLGIFFHNPATDDGRPECVVAKLNALPPLGADCRAFPSDDDQEPAAPSASKFTLSVGNRGDQGRIYYHQVGVVFHNPPRDGSPENWRIVFDTLPFHRELRGYPLPAQTETDESSEGQTGSGRSSNRAA